MPHNVSISLKEGERPLDKRGALCAISPEEVRHAMMAAIARDISNGVESEVLEEWRRKVLSRTATFQVHATEAERSRVAMQLRENMANDHETMRRTQLQRIYEIIFFRDQYAKTHGRDQATAANIAAEYGNMRMAKGRERISKSFVDTALTIHARLLPIPEAERLLLEMDSNVVKGENPFNSVHRLQAIVSKCGNSKENAMWVLRHIAHMVTHLAISASSADFSVEGLRGSPRTGNRGLIDTILLKKEALGYPMPQVAGPTWDRGRCRLAIRPPREPGGAQLPPCIPERRWPSLVQPPHACPGSLCCVREGPSIWGSPHPTPQKPNQGWQNRGCP